MYILEYGEFSTLEHEDNAPHIIKELMLAKPVSDRGALVSSLRDAHYDNAWMEEE
jgi:hypothetical protein